MKKDGDDLHYDFAKLSRIKVSFILKSYVGFYSEKRILSPLKSSINRADFKMMFLV